MASYSYSLDRQVWTGRFESRTEAAQAAIARALKESSPPETVHVGQRVEPDLRTYGYARGIIDTMRRRVREDNGDIADGFLSGVREDQIVDLDRALESAIVDWLNRFGLEPQWARIEAVGQYPMPTVAPRNALNGTQQEVSDIGVEDSGQA